MFLISHPAMTLDDGQDHSNWYQNVKFIVSSFCQVWKKLLCICSNTSHLTMYERNQFVNVRTQANVTVFLWNHIHSWLPWILTELDRMNMMYIRLLSLNSIVNSIQIKDELCELLGAEVLLSHHPVTWFKVKGISIHIKVQSSLVFIIKSSLNQIGF